MKTDHEIALYIKPRNGPIRPMRLNITAIQEAADNAPDHYNKDEIRLQEIVRQIRKTFDKVDPRSNMDSLRAILSRLSTADHFNGMVISMGGTIEEEGTSEVELVQKEIEESAQEFVKVQRKLADEQKEHGVLKAQVAGLQAQNNRLKILYDKDHEQLATLISQKERMQQAARQARAEADRWRTEAERQQQMVAQLTTRLELAQKVAQERPAQQAQQSREAADLRREISKLKKGEQSLKETIASLEQERDVLHDRLRMLTEGPSGSNATVNDDPYEL